MKKLLTVFALLLLLGICSVSSADVLYYNVFGSARSVDNLVEGFDRTSINGFLVMEIDEAAGDVTASTLVLYGRDGQEARVYKVYDEAVSLNMSGSAAVFVMNPSEGVTLVLTGTLRNTRLSFSRRNSVTVYAAATLSGSIQLQWGSLLDINQLLMGEGSVMAFLNYAQTMNAVVNESTIDDVVNEIIQRLESRDYIPVPDEEEPLPL
ncbi:MAG: hypothetical protein JW749_06315 [Sedimentisphaerales bacterium]|nr:hypothetical protein [Sedimentisphaerales bacterium]